MKTGIKAVVILTAIMALLSLSACSSGASVPGFDISVRPADAEGSLAADASGTGADENAGLGQANGQTASGGSSSKDKPSGDPSGNPPSDKPGNSGQGDGEAAKPSLVGTWTGSDANKALWELTLRENGTYECRVYPVADVQGYDQGNYEVGENQTAILTSFSGPSAGVSGQYRYEVKGHGHVLVAERGGDAVTLTK